MTEAEFEEYVNDLKQIDFDLVRTLYNDVYKAEAEPTGDIKAFPAV